MATLRSTFALTLLSSALACGSARQTTSASGTAGASETASESSGEAETVGEGEIAEHLLECGAPLPCDTASYQVYGGGVPDRVPSDETLQCIIDALDAREPALIVVSRGCEGQCHGDIYLIRSDGTAFNQSYYGDGNVEDGAVLVTFPDGFETSVEPWAEAGEICDLVAPGTCTPETCGSTADWFLNCESTQINSCEP